MHLREAARQGRLVALAGVLALLPSCGAGAPVAERVPIGEARTPEELRKILEAIAPRTDHEAARARALIYARLREQNPGSWELLANGDAADVDLLSQAALPEYKVDAAARLARHFRERAKTPALAKSAFQGDLAEPLRRFVLLTVAAPFGEYASRAEHAEALDRLAEAAEALAGLEALLTPKAQNQWHGRAKAYALRAKELRADEGPGEPGIETRKFCEISLSRHLEEATRAADAGTQELAGRGNPDRAVEWFLSALAHYALVRECAADPSSTQEHGLAAVEIVVRSLGDLLRREP